MKKIVLIIFWSLGVIVCNAQDREFLSLGSIVIEKDSAGMFMEGRAFTFHEVRIKFSPDQKKMEFFSKGFLDRDPFRLINEIKIREKMASRDVNDHPSPEFSGIDKRGRKCTIKLMLFKDAYSMAAGELRIEYANRA